MHLHRGIETVTYMLAGQIKHEDRLGNAGVIGPGDIQMTYPIVRHGPFAMNTYEEIETAFRDFKEGRFV